jgi:hypothetical protein
MEQGQSGSPKTTRKLVHPTQLQLIPEEKGRPREYNRIERTPPAASADVSGAHVWLTARAVALGASHTMALGTMLNPGASVRTSPVARCLAYDCCCAAAKVRQAASAVERHCR